MDQVDLPDPPVAVFVPGVPFEAAVLLVEQVGVLHPPDPGLRGDAGHGGKTIFDPQRGRGVDVQVDIRMLHQQPCSERSHHLGPRSDLLPRFAQPQVVEDCAGAALVGLGQSKNFVRIVHGFRVYRERSRDRAVHVGTVLSRLKKAPEPMGPELVFL